MPIFLYDFLSILAGLGQSFKIRHIIKKVVCSILNVYFLDVSHLYLFNGIAFNGTAFNGVAFKVSL